MDIEHKRRRLGEDSDGGPLPWSSLPSELVNTVLAWLPLRSLLRFRCVCKGWNAAFLSPRFTHFPSCVSSPFDAPWLVFFEPKNFDFAAFDFASASWLKLSMAFLYDHTPIVERVGIVWCTGSARGRLLLDVESSLYVCYPLTKALFALPPFNSIKLIIAQGFAPDHRNHGCKIIVVGQCKAKSGLLIEKYCGKEDSWDVVGSLPSSFVIRHDEMAVCDGCFFALLKEPQGMLVIMDEGRQWTFSTLPVTSLRLNQRLVVCWNLLFLVGCLYGDEGFQNIFFWRFDAQGKNWKFVASMPTTMAEVMKGITSCSWIDCVGVGNLICLRPLGGSKVLTYNICGDNAWDWLPDWPFSDSTVWTKGFRFEARVEALHCIR